MVSYETHSDVSHTDASKWPKCGRLVKPLTSYMITSGTVFTETFH